VDSHGVIRLKIYTEHLKAGGFKADVSPIAIKKDEATALLDAQQGLGQVAAMEAMRMAIAMAAKSGVGVVAVRNSNHFGAAAFYALEAARAGMIGLATTNAGPSMAPTGGCERRLGNNPVAIAVPAMRHPPIVLDLATGAVAWGKIFLAQQEKRKIPTSWALDKHGQPTDDPGVAADQGLIQPFGGYKGYGLSLVLDILSGVLSGGGFSTAVNGLYEDIAAPSQVAHTCAALRIDSFLPLEEFGARVDAMIDLMHSSRPASGTDRIYVPGEIEAETERRRQTEGIPLSEALLDELQRLGAELRVTW
jgi:LDH2 family malate/lactate/ureidoglycolate dehydrogenase